VHLTVHAGRPTAEKNERRNSSERDVFLPRVPYNRSATYVFDKTVAPDQDIADITHEKVSDMLEDVFAAKELFRGRHASPCCACAIVFNHTVGVKAVKWYMSGPSSEMSSS
jgi:hypothetical protein